MSREKKFVWVDTNGTKKETEKAYLFAMLDGTEMWVPKSQCKNVEYNGCEITEYILKQKNYSGNIKEEGWKCVNCGAETKKGYKYCLECYKKEKLRITGYESGIGEDTYYNYNVVDIDGYCRNCGHRRGFEYKDGKVFCERCDIKLADGLNEWVNVVKKCEKCKNGNYEPYGYFVLKCNNCNHMLGVEPIGRQTKKQGGKTI